MTDDRPEYREFIEQAGKLTRPELHRFLLWDVRRIQAVAPETPEEAEHGPAERVAGRHTRRSGV
jgi:hypothetical protein